MRTPTLLLMTLMLSASVAPQPPSRMLWSWFESDDFHTLKPGGPGVAWLALSLDFTARDVTPVPRFNSVKIPPGVYQMAVIRFDTNQDHPLWTVAQRKKAVGLILELAKVVGATSLQLDFDTPPAARAFYTELLQDLRSQLRPDVFLSVTALVSWCMEPNGWLDNLPVSEIVPMAFSMGATTPAMRTMLARGGDFSEGRCRYSIGISTAGPNFPLKAGRRVYIFNNGAKWYLP